MATIMEKKNQIKEKLNEISSNLENLIELDFDFSVLSVAVLSYRYESVLKPFPSTFITDTNTKRYDDLVNTLLSMPPVSKWKVQLDNFNEDQLGLVYWLTMDRSYSIKYRQDLIKEDLKSIVNYITDIPKANYIFEFIQNDEKSKKFDELKAIHGSTLAFHGTKFDNFYSILNIGLLNHLNKTSLFGEGTYLSQEPSVSLHYSPSNSTWDKSIIGQRMSCLLICETINDRQHVKMSEKSSSNNSIPEKYFIVKNDDYIRVKYLVVYAEKQAKLKSNSNRLRHMLVENKFALMLFSYGFLLLTIGLMNSKTFHKYIKFGYKKISSLLLGEATYD